MTGHNKKFAVIGGDSRSIELARQLKADGHIVNIYGFDNAILPQDVKNQESLQSAMDGCEIIIGPVPCSNDGETVNTPFSANKISLADMFKAITKDQIFIAGRIIEKIQRALQVFNVHYLDILDREEVSIMNAIPTSEGAIKIAIEKTPITLHDSNIMVIGFGRIGKVLSKMLAGIGSNVFVVARRCEDLAWISSYGYKEVLTDNLAGSLPNMEIIFNTVPAPILTKDILSHVKKDCLIIDLASAPGGVDFIEADKLGLQTVWALSLPGKVAPTTCAKFIKDAIYNIINELGV